MAENERSLISPATNAHTRQRPIAPTFTRVYDSHEVNPDHSITFRLDAPNAEAVDLVSDVTAEVLPLTKGQDGLWAVTTSPLPPALYAYAFSVDGVDQPDPRNSWPKPSLISAASLVLIPGTAAKPWEPAVLPHGTVHSHVYTTTAVEGLLAGQSRYLVYTPPAYDPNASQTYPVLYLLHGWSDSETAWTQIGQAHLILDALIASGRSKPMIVVMPLGYGQMSFVEEGIGVWQSPTAITANVMHFQRALLNEVMPQVESIYNVRRNREDCAIAGLSMGGLQALVIGLNHADRFGWIGGFSSALSLLDHVGAPELLPNLSSSTPKPGLVWISCGIEDPLLAYNRTFIAWLKQQNVSVTALETPGGHTWPIWRDDLIRLAPLLFAGDL